MTKRVRKTNAPADLIRELTKHLAVEEAKAKAEAEKRLVCGVCGVGQCPRCYCD